MFGLRMFGWAQFAAIVFAFAVSIASSEALAQTTLLSVDGANFQYKSVGGAIGTDWNIWTNGYIENSLYFPTTASYQFQIQAYGSVAAKVWPIMELRIDQQVVSRVTVNSSSAMTYTQPATVTAGTHQIELAFTNDYATSRQDRNLYIKHLNVIAASTATTTTTTTTLPVTASAPDLIVTGVTWSPSAPVAGNAVTFSVTVKNSGTAATPVGTDIGVSFLVDNQQVSWASTTSNLAAGASMTLTANGGPLGSSTWSATSGTHTVVAFVDDVNRIAESNENNNQFTAPAMTVGLSTATSSSGAAGPTISTFTPSGPITLVSGQTVTGLAISNPNGPCIYGNGATNVHIYNNKIGPCGSTESGVGVMLYTTHDALVEHNSFDDVATAFLAVSSTDNIVFDHNYATRIRGPFPRGQLAQFNQVNGSGNKITCNVSDQTTPGYGTGTEDHISMYSSNGTATSPVLIKYNKLRGGGPSNSGGGIILGDNGGSYLTADSNILVNPGQYGISIASGHDNRLLNNKVYSASFSWSNVGVFVWNQYPYSCYNAEVSGNRSNWTNSSGVNDASTAWWNGGNCGTITMSNDVFPDYSLNTSIWDQVIPECQ